MKKGFFALIFVVFLIFIFGCTQQETSTTESVYSGTQGLVMSFVAQNPPSEVFEGSPLTVLVEYANKGAITITNGRMYLTGYDKAYLFDGAPYKEISLNGLEGKSLLNPVGEEKIGEFIDSSVSKPDDVDRFTQKLKLTACYDYETKASAQVCIDPNPYDLSGGKKTCTVGIVSLSGGQGAPVAVTKIDERIAGNRVQFKIYFRNVGSGDVYDGSVSHCYSAIEYSQLNKVVVDSVKFSNINLQCEPSLGTAIRLNNGEGFVICYYEGNLGADEYLTTLNINLRYTYRDDSPIKTIDILDVPGKSSSPSRGTPSGGGSHPGVGSTCYDSKGRPLGICQYDSTSCSGGYVTGYCKGMPTNIRCCVTANCFAPYENKRCKETSQPCTGGYIAQKCPGPDNVRCCMG